MKKIMVTLLIVVSLLYSADGKTGGKVFFNYTYDSADDAALEQSFGLTRVYFSYEKELAENLKYKFQTDIDHSATPLNVYLKNAKVELQTKLGKFIFGLQGMNVFNVQEKTWGRRFIEKSAMDKYKFASSADMGLGFAKTLGKNVHFSVLLTNGAGYKHTENDDHKKLSTQVVMGQNKLTSGGYNLGGVFTYEPYDMDDGTTETKTVIGVFGGYTANGLRAGAEFDMLKDSGADLTKQIISVYTNYVLNQTISAFGMVNLYDPNTNTSDDSHTFIIAGLDYVPAKGLVIAPNVQYTIPEIGDSYYQFVVNFLFKM